MPEGLFSRRLSLGTYAGIPLFVHWTFLLSVLLVSFLASETGIGGVAFSIAQLLGVFFCITLHEYGHALAARRFGIRTVDITLLPIGGVARLNKIPRIAWQELVIAVAGPAVNVVIVGVLAVVLVITLDQGIIDSFRTYFGELPLLEAVDAATSALDEIAATPSWNSYLVLLMLVNVILIVFNMIPAFPMDGGRVLRSLMAMVMDYRRATWIASRVGLVCAAIMAFLAVRGENVWVGLLLVACFVAYAGLTEARQVNVTETVRKLTVADVMVRGNHHGIPMDTPAIEVTRLWKDAAFSSLPIVSPGGTVVGMLSLHDVLKQLSAGLDRATPAGAMVNRQHPGDQVPSSASVESVLGGIDKYHRQLAVVDPSGYLLGLFDLDTMLARADLARHHSTVAAQGHPNSPDQLAENSSAAQHFDAIS